MQTRTWTRPIVAAAILAATPVLAPASADAAAAVSATSGYDLEPRTVGEVLSTSLTVANQNTPPDTTLTLNDIVFVPSCATAGPITTDCPEASADPGSVVVVSQAAGAADTACAGTVFAASEPDPGTGSVAFTSAAPVILAAPDDTDESDVCRINFAVEIVRLPVDSRPNLEGVQTDGFAFARGTASGGLQAIASGGSAMTVQPEQAAGIEVEKTADPLSLPEPGGDFTFTVVVRNPSEQPMTILTLVDDIYGDLAELGDCGELIGLTLEPDGSGTCSFVGEFTGVAGDIQTDVVTVTAEDDAGATVTASDEAVVAITPAPTTTSTTAPPTTSTTRPSSPTTSPPTTTPRSTPTTAPGQPRLAATGTEPATTLSVGVGLAGVGLLLLGQAVRLSARRRPGSGAGSH